jgi:peptidoglycan-associated lipoprotein
VRWIVTCALLLVAACGSDAKPKTPVCHGPKDCKDGTVCVENKCVQCGADADCPNGQHCDLPTNACVAKPECTQDKDCPGGKVCQANHCTACASDSECGTGGACVAGGCTKAKACTKDDECADDEDCVGGFCHKGGMHGSATSDTGCTLQTVYFGFDQAAIDQSERERLDANSACIEKSKQRSVFVVGHTDTSGTEEYNIALSERRAQAVADYLARLGTDPARLQVVPKGETEPTGLGDDKDRRVEFQWH